MRTCRTPTRLLREARLVWLGLALITAAARAAPVPADYLPRREFAAGVEEFRARFSTDPTDPAAARDLARLFAAWRKPDSSLHWWNRALSLEPGSDSATRGRWQMLVRSADKDSLALARARETIAAEVEPLLAETTESALGLAWDGLSLADTARARELAGRLTALFPDSPRGYDLIGWMFYDSLNPVWTDDTLKIPLLRRFLARFPRTEWRSTFYFFLLSSHYSLGDTAGALPASVEMLADDPLDPFRARYAAAILNRLGTRPDSAAAWARRAIALDPGYAKPPNKPLPQWELEQPVLAASARVALAEALLAMDSLAAAREQALAAVRLSSFHPDLEATPGPAWAILGLIEERRGDTAAAVEACARALVAGDVRNQWTPRADSALARLWPGTRLDASRAALGFAGPVFSDVTEEYGLGHERGSRVAWGDYDGDGYEDLLVNGSRLYRNDSGLGFTEVTAEVGLADARGRGGVWGDFDNDGKLDFLMSGSDGPDIVWFNTGAYGPGSRAEGAGKGEENSLPSGGFPAQSAGAGFRPETLELTLQVEPDGSTGTLLPGEGIALADFDNDGLLDIYVANYEDWATHSYFPDQLYRNTGNGFADRTDSAGIRPPWDEDRAGRGVAWADFDDDGFPDCFVANYRLQENFLWHNRGNGTFENRAAGLGVAGDEVNGWFGHTIGAAWGDYDNDGDLDLFTADLAHPRYIEFSNRSRLYDNLGPDSVPRFRDRRAGAGIRFEETHSNPAWADVDNDGWLDLYITSIYEGRRSFLYRSLGPETAPSAREEAVKTASFLRPTDLRPASRREASGGKPVFKDITWLSGTRAFNGWGCAFADMNNNGRLDLVVGSGSGLRLFRNETQSDNNWLQVRVAGRTANRAGIGARVTVETRSGSGRKTRVNRRVREVEGGSGTTSQNSLIQHFGLGAEPGPVTVRVRFGPGREQVVENVAVNRRLTVEEHLP